MTLALALAVGAGILAALFVYLEARRERRLTRTLTPAFPYRRYLRPIGSAPLDRHFSEDHPGRERVGYVARHNGGRRG